ncbi:MAG: DUF2188 domain-containing protein [Saprospiraceae bacterium]|nr:DUF2188 domain-containing protein [Saprospiraceae bacterium]
MTAKTNHVVPARQKGWAVIKSGAIRASRLFSSKREAIIYGRLLSRSEATILYVHKRDGTVQNRNSYINES